MRFLVTSAILAATSAPVLAAEGTMFPPFDTSTFAGQLFWLAITFGTLYLLMSRVALPRIGSILEERQEKIERALGAASDAQKAAETSASELETSLAKAKANAQAIAQEARTKSGKEIDAKRKTVESDLAAKMIAAESAIAETKAKAMANVEDIAREAVEAMVETLTGKKPTAAAITKAVGAARGE
ncbi:MAG: F0F1 ATP synthase subunit B' [Proteobacteria bacterium]|nr:F0F1 ATP synthase subunit B' [Pseudomonadota bacterium]